MTDRFDAQDLVRLREAATAVGAQAAAAIRAIPRTDLARRDKADRSPVTAADQAAEHVILAGLAAIAPAIPVVSEECVAAGECPSFGDCFFLVDPLDGTREFIDGRDEYTVNIALVFDGRPQLGVIVAPARDVLWRGSRGGGAERLQLSHGSPGPAVAIQTRRWPREGAVAAVSRSHPDPKSDAFLASAGATQRLVAGSALKFCAVAEGSADIYPRLSQTCEWDVAAGHALIESAGGLMTAPDGGRLVYGGSAGGFLVPGFLAWGDPTRAA